MKIVRYHVKGSPEVLQLEEAPVPEPGAGEVLVRIEATGVGYADVLRRSGGYYPTPVTLPHIPGTLVAGTVESVGPGVDSALLGKAVLGPVTTGAYAEYGLAAATSLRGLPAGSGAAEAIAILSEADTAAYALKLGGRLQPGETVFIPAATGGVGYMAVQLAQLYGAAKVYGGASSEAKRVVVAELGAIPIDYTIEGWPADLIALNGGKGVDLALEVGGGQSVYDTLDATRAGGRVVNYGNVADINAPVNPRALLRRNQTLVGFGRTGMIRDGLLLEERRQIDQEIDAFVAAGKLRPLIGGRFRLDQATEAHRALENRQTAGKVILMPHGFEPDA